MRLSTLIYSSIYLSGILAQDVDLELSGSFKNTPHNVVINFKRDIPAEIEDVVDSNTIPIEDQDSDRSLVPEHVVSTVSGKDYEKSLENQQVRISSDEDNNNEGSNKSPLIMAISMIVVSEIGDKTFLISALMAMRHSRLLVFTASFASLAIMTILSGIVGHTLPSLISQKVTQFLASGLFIIFGIKLTKEGLAMSKDLGVDEELAEVEEELEVTDLNYELNDVESQNNNRSSRRRPSNPNVEREVKLINSVMSHLKGAFGLIFHPVWIQVFIMIFLGEWGDRSQIATIAMAAGSDYWAVILGAVIGHGLCTIAAVIGGKILASRISMRTVTLGGAFAFFVFAILYFVEAYNNNDQQ